MCDFTAKMHRGQVANLRANLPVRSLATCENWFIVHDGCAGLQLCATWFAKPISPRTISCCLSSSAKRSINDGRSRACPVFFSSPSTRLSMRRAGRKTPDSRPFFFLEFPTKKTTKQAALMQRTAWSKKHCAQSRANVRKWSPSPMFAFANT
jgi:hypothetical protein